MRKNVCTFFFIRALMAGFISGIIAAAASFIYLLWYRSASGSAYGVISPFILMVGVPVLMTLSGILFFWSKRYLHKGTVWYSIMFFLLLLVIIFNALMAPGEISLSGYKGVLIGVEMITGLIAIFLIPYITRRLSIFRTQEGLYNR